MDIKQDPTIPRQPLLTEKQPEAHTVRQETAHLPPPDTPPHAERYAMLARLTATLSHEIGNPLHTIFLHADLLEEDLRQLPAQASEPMLSCLRDMKAEATRLHAIMQDYLTVVRLGELTYQPEGLEPLVEACSLEIHELLEAGGLTLHVEGLASLGLVALHRTTLQRALAYLLRQTACVMPVGGVLSICGRQEGQRACIEISGSGAGIPAAELPSVFEPWQRRLDEGTGLELYVAQEVVTAHRGRLTVQSPEGQGILFTMLLPCVEGM